MLLAFAVLLVGVLCAVAPARAHAADADALQAASLPARAAAHDGASDGAPVAEAVPAAGADAVTTQAKKRSGKVFTVRFYDAFGNIAKVQEVRKGKRATPPRASSMKMKGRAFKRWDSSYKNVSSDLYIHPVYKDRKGVYILAIDESYAPKSGSIGGSRAIGWARWRAGSSIVAGDARYGFGDYDLGAVTGWYTKPNGQGRYIAYGSAFKMPSNDLVLYPAYAHEANARRYTLTFDSNRAGVASYERGGIHAGATVQIPVSMAQESGYTKVGYSTKRNGKGSFYALGSAFSMPRKNLKLYGVWKKNAVRVRVQPGFEGNEAAPVSYFVPANTSLPIDNFTGVSVKPSRSATWIYGLKLLSTKKNGKGKRYRVHGSGHVRDVVYLDVGKDDVTLHASWMKLDKAVTIDPNGGVAEEPGSYYDSYKGKRASSGNYVDRENAKGDLVQLPAASSFSREGCVLVGYSAKKGRAAAYFPKQFVVLKKNLKLYAVWAKAAEREVAFTYDPNRPGEEAYTVKSMVAPGFESSVPHPSLESRAGSYFAGWTTEKKGTVAQYVPGNTWIAPSRATTLHVVWGRCAVVVFNCNYPAALPAADGASGSRTDASLYTDNYLAGMTYIDGFVPTCSGYAFTGWNAREDGTGTRYDVGKQVRLRAGKTLTLYAQWARKGAVLTLDSNFTEKGAAESDAVVIPVAKKLPLGENHSGDDDATYGRPYSSSYFTYYSTRENYAFTGWNTKANGTGKSYASSLAFDKIALKGDVTLYAQWRRLPKVTYRSGKRKIDEYGIIYPFSDRGFTKKGRVLVAWNTRKDGSGREFSVGEAVANMLPGKTVLYPQFKKPARKSSLTFVSQGEELKTVAGVAGAFNLLTELGSFEAPMRDGYYFNGWNTKRNGRGNAYGNGTYTDYAVDDTGEKSRTFGYTFGSAWVPKKGATLYAQWEKASSLTLDLNYVGAAAVKIWKHAGDSAYVYFSDEVAVPVRDGYELDGWSTDEAATASEYSYSYYWDASDSATDTALYAVWVERASAGSDASSQAMW